MVLSEYKFLLPTNRYVLHAVVCCIFEYCLSPKCGSQVALVGSKQKLFKYQVQYYGYWFQEKYVTWCLCTLRGITYMCLS